MASLIPYVEPAVNSAGNPISTTPRIIFEQAIDAGIVNGSNFFIVGIDKTGKDGIDDYLQDVNVVSDIVPAKVSHRRINLNDEEDYAGVDHGDTASAGELYRSEITITPDQPLPPNTNLAAILSKNITPLTVFDPKPDAGNSGSGEIIAQGVYTGLVSDTYTISVVSGGGKYSAKYVWIRSSDSQSSLALDANGKYVEIDRGIKVKFLDGAYDIGDTFTIQVIPRDNQTELYSWNFSTGLGSYQVPDDERSGDIIDLEVVDEDTPSLPAGQSLTVDSITPGFAATNLRVGTTGYVVVGSVVFKTKEKTDDFNGYKFSFTGGGIAGSEVVTQNSNNIEITIESQVSTAQQIVDAFNAFATTNTLELEAATSCPDTSQKKVLVVEY
jgi:hypothetical protein